MIFNLSKEKLKKDHVTYLAAFAIVFIPLGTYLLGTKESPFDYTLSKIGNLPGQRLNFVLWGVVTGLMLTFYIIRLYVLKSFEDPKARRLLVWSLVFLILTVLIPAVEQLPLLSKLHTLMAVAFAICLLISIYLFIKHLEVRNKSLFSLSLYLFYGVVGGSLMMLFLFGVNGVFELFFFISLSVFLMILNAMLRK